MLQSEPISPISFLMFIIAIYDDVLLSIFLNVFSNLAGF